MRYFLSSIIWTCKETSSSPQIKLIVTSTNSMLCPMSLLIPISSKSKIASSPTPTESQSGSNSELMKRDYFLSPLRCPKETKAIIPIPSSATSYQEDMIHKKFKKVTSESMSKIKIPKIPKMPKILTMKVTVINGNISVSTMCRVIQITVPSTQEWSHPNTSFSSLQITQVPFACVTTPK
jgi:hypothetical protein